MADDSAAVVDAFVDYFAVYRSEHKDDDPAEGCSYICTGLFGEIEEALTEAGFHLADVTIDRGRMQQPEWDAIEEVPDDFVASRS